MWAICQAKSSLHIHIHDRTYISLRSWLPCGSIVAVVCLIHCCKSKSTQIFEGYVCGLCCRQLLSWLMSGPPSPRPPLSLLLHATCQATPITGPLWRRRQEDEPDMQTHKRHFDPRVCHLNGNDIVQDIVRRTIHFRIQFFPPRPSLCVILGARCQVPGALICHQCYHPIFRPPMSMASRTNRVLRRQINFIRWPSSDGKQILSIIYNLRYQQNLKSLF